MEMSGSSMIPANVEVTWQALNDPQFLMACIKGCESIDADGENAYKVVMAAKIGPVSARFKGRLTLDDLDPPNAYSLSFEGQGGVAGFAKGSARVSLSPGESVDATLLSYEVRSQIGGKLAQLGARLIDGAARKIADDFFVAFTARIAAGNPGDPAGAAAL